MTRTKSTYLALLAALLAPMAANAVPIVTSGPCENAIRDCFTSILGFELGGSTYDVTWVEGTYDDVLATNPGVAAFVGDATSAETAANLINVLFNDAGNLPVFSGLSITWGAVYVAYDVTATNASSWLGFSTVDFVFDVTSPRVTVAPFAVFSPTAVPEPGTLALLGLGLAGTGMSRRKKKV